MLDPVGERKSLNLKVILAKKDFLWINAPTMAGELPKKCMRKVFSIMMVIMIKMMMMMMIAEQIYQGCGKCLFCLKISALCECTEEDKVGGLFSFITPSFHALYVTL